MMIKTVLNWSDVHLRTAFFTELQPKPVFLDFIYPRRRAGTDTFHWYVGHDPYNSLDNIAFMDRLVSRVNR